MNLNEIIKATYHNNQFPNPTQLKAIKHIEGPLLIVAGSGSGKTKTLITRTLNLLLCHNVASENILLCTFTEKAARQLRDRVNADLKKCGADDIDIHGMTIGTIHSICQRIIDEYPNEAGTGLYHKTKGLGRGYVILDELKRTFFMMDHFDEIFGNPLGLEKRYLGLWKGFWDTIENSQEYFDKITEENVDVKKLIKSSEAIHSVLGKAMQAYRRLLVQEGRIDFAHMEWLAYDLLQNNPGAKREFHNKFEHIMVDEYQDTNYIQEQLIFTLANKDKNIAVVGDVDQSIYRFRGATTQNILKFPERVGQIKTASINLGINYRSSQKIIDLYQSYRDEIDWHGCRYPLNVESDKTKEQNRPDYITTIKINEENSQIEGNKVADLIVTLKDTGVIDDYNQVAILLYSVRPNHSSQYIEAISNLKDKGEEIEVYAPRARLFFERPEVMCLLAGFYTLNNVDLSEITGGYSSQETESIKDYLTRCIKEFRRRKGSPGHGEFQKKIKDISDQIKALKKTENKPVKTDLMNFYHIMNTDLKGRWHDQELPARHLAQISQLLEVFSEYYGYEWIGGKNADHAWAKFFNSFLRVLVDGGLNEYEDDEQAFPSGAVQVMTFHQSKGLEFPVVIVGSLHAQVRSGKKVDDILSDYYHRDLAENRAYISEFDKRRLYYVAFLQG